MESRSDNLWTDAPGIATSVRCNAGDRNPAWGTYWKLGDKCVAIAGVKWLERELGYREINCVRIPVT